MPEISEWQNHKGYRLDTVNDFEVIECERCGFKHILPIPTPMELENIYRQEYYTMEKPLYLERHREDLDWWNLVYARRYELFEKHLPHDEQLLALTSPRPPILAHEQILAHERRPRRILDVGSGPGFFLLHGQKRGWQTMGIEPSAQAADHSRRLGLEIIEGFLCEQMVDQLGTTGTTGAPGGFDVVHLHEVLEHIPDPAKMLGLIRRLLNPGGLLCVIVPNDYNPLQRILHTSLNYKPWWLAPPHHINYFCFESVERLIRSTGFSPVHKEATFPMELFLLMGENYVGDDSVGRKMHGMRKTLELNLAAADAQGKLFEFYARLAECGLGRECVVVATPK